MKILIIEDEAAIREELTLLLQNALYEVCTVTHFSNVAEQAIGCVPDLILLDINLPGIDGLTVCTQIRAVLDVPIIFVTGLSGSMDELNGILRGGDDYITKPFQAPILLARIAAVLKRSHRDNTDNSTQLQHKGITLDAARSTVSANGKSVELTKNELQVLYFLFLHKNQIVSRADLAEYLWDNQIFIDDNTLSVNITRIRNKLKEIDIDNLIETKRGMGYRI